MELLRLGLAAAAVLVSTLARLLVVLAAVEVVQMVVLEYPELQILAEAAAGLLSLEVVVGRAVLES
jgi:hypothetical protein